MQRLARVMVARRYLLLAIAAALAAVCVPVAARLKSDRSVQTLFAHDDPRLLLYNRTAVEFGGEATVLAVYSDPQALTLEGLTRLKEFRDALARVPNVRSALCLADLPHPHDPGTWRDLAGTVVDGTEAAFRSGLDALTQQLRTWRPKPLLRWFATLPPDQQKTLAADVLATEMYRNIFISEKGDTVAVVMQFDRDAMASGEMADSIDQMRAISATIVPGPARLVGAPIMISDVYGYLHDDARRLQWVSMLAMVAVIFVLFRNIRWVALPLAVVWLATEATRALMAAADIRLSIIGSMTESLITVIGIATVVHVAVLYGEEASKQGIDPEVALERTLARILGAFGWTCATTAVGFASVAVSRVRPVQEYALVMSSASLLVGLASMLLLPAGTLMLRRLAPAAPRPVVGEAALNSGLHWIVGFVERHSFLTAGVVFAVMGIAGIGFRSLAVETEFTKNFRADAPILDSYNFVETNLGGAGVLEVVFDAPNPDPDLLDRMRACERDLRALPAVTKVSGLADAVDYAQSLLGSQRLLTPRAVTQPAAYVDGDAPGWRKWLSKAVVERAFLGAIRTMPNGQARSLAGTFWNPAADRMRLVLRVRERLANEGKSKLLADVRRICRTHLGDGAEVTGMFVLLVNLIDTLVSDQWSAVGVSAVGVIFMASLAFRSLRMGLVAFAPKIVLVFAVIGTMGWLGLKVNVATAMIGSVSMGLVVAFSVPYLTRFRQERLAGAGFYAAIVRSHGSAGKAMVFANLALMLGFLVLGLSRFVPTIHFGLLVSVAILGGVVGNLILLPVLLRLVYLVPAPTEAELEELHV